MTMHIIMGLLILGAIVSGCLAMKDRGAGEQALNSVIPGIVACACIAWLALIAVGYFFWWLL